MVHSLRTKRNMVVFGLYGHSRDDKLFTKGSMLVFGLYLKRSQTTYKVKFVEP